MVQFISPTSDKVKLHSHQRYVILANDNPSYHISKKTLSISFQNWYFQLLLFLFSYHTCYGHQGPTPAQALLGYSPTPGTPAPIHLYTPKGFAPSPSPFPEAASPLPPNVALVTPSPVPIHGPTAFVTPAPLPVHGPVGYIPPQQEYHGHCDSRIAPYCANVTGLHYCLEDPQYPEYDLKLAISQDYLFEKKFSDVVDQSANDLVESISAKEVSSNFSYSKSEKWLWS